jgi:hypothetical protein
VGGIMEELLKNLKGLELVNLEFEEIVDMMEDDVDIIMGDYGEEIRFSGLELIPNEENTEIKFEYELIGNDNKKFKTHFIWDI